MAAVFDAVGPSSSGQGTSGATLASTASWNHTCSGTNLVLIVGIAIGANPDSMTAAVTYNGVAMTAGSVVHSGGTTGGYAQIFSLVAPATGTNSVALTLTGGTATISAGSVSFTAANQTAPLGTAVTANDANTASTAATVNVTGTTSGNPVIDMLAQGSNTTATVGAGQTVQWQKVTNGTTRAGCGAQSIETSGGGTVTMSWTLGAADHWGIIAAEVLPAAAAGPEPGRFLLAS